MFAIMGMLEQVRRQTAVIIRNAEVLEADYIPDQIVGRDTEIKQLSHPLLHLVDAGGRGGTTAVRGKSGMGKTMTLKAVLSDLSQELRTKGRSKEIKAIYVHVQRGDRAQIVRDILLAVDPQMATLAKKTSDPKQLFVILDEVCKERGIKAIVLVIDEAHLMSDLDLILSKFTRREAGFGTRTQLYLISNNMDYLRDLPPRVTSALDLRTEVLFADYSREQLEDILAHRIELGFAKGSVPADVVRNIAATAVKHFGSDARMAIRLLAMAAQVAEAANCKVVEVEHVQSARDQLQQKQAEDSLRELPDNDKQALAGLLVVAKRGVNPVPFNLAYEAFAGVVRFMGSQPPSPNSLRNYLAGLEQLGHVVQTRRAVGKGNHQVFLSLQNAAAVESMLSGAKDDRLQAVISDPSKVRLNEESMKVARKNGLQRAL